MTAIKFTIGKEKLPYVEDILRFTQEDLENSFFKNAYEKSFELIEEIILQFDNLASNKQDLLNDQMFGMNKINNIIAYIGERGSGKTSCMLSVYKALEDFEKNTYRDSKLELFRKLDKQSFYTLPIIDPSYFEKSSNLLVIIIANMFKRFQEEVAKPNNDRYAPRLLEDKRELVSQFQLVKETLDRIADNNSAPHSNDSLEDLVAMSSTINLHQDLTNLVKCYLRFMDKKNLVIAIDDIDHEIDHAHKMIEQIRKYFLIPNVIILSAVKLTQLTDILKQNYLKEYDKLYSQNLLSDTIANIAGRYLSKFIPYNHRIYLPVLKNNSSQPIIITMPSEEKKLMYDSIDQAVLQLIFDKTRIMFYNSMDRENLIVPYNLRDLLGLITFLYRMPKLDDNEANNDGQIHANKKYNREQFKEYFIETWCGEHLNAAQYDFIRSLNEQKPAQLNKFTIDFLCVTYSVEIGNKEVVSSNNRSYNISLGDVNYILDKVETQHNTIDVIHFVFAIKTLYSIFLYEAYDEMNSPTFRKVRNEVFCYKFNIKPASKNESSLEKDAGNRDEKYVQDSVMIRKANKLAVYSDYERILGGNLIRISGNIQYNNKLNIGVIDASYLNKIYNFLISEEETDISADINDIDKKQLFDMFVFFMLTTSNPHIEKNFRTYRHCFYDTYMFQLREQNTRLVFDTLSILFNIVKYYNLHICYADTHGSIDPYINKSKQLDQFYRLIFKYEGSLLHQIVDVRRDENVLINDKSRIHDYFIRNIEILDLLHDYLPYIKRPRNKNDDDNLDNLMDFFQKLSSFNFYTYHKDLSETKEITSKDLGTLASVTEFLSRVKNDSKLKLIFDKIYNSDNILKQ